ncbi:MAG: hypothetical protein Q7S30_00355 [Candidatus Omnitrophota bacterium]|nr:hypothetical protein [Candidatus Omnitrophota bacterium]
MISQCPGSGRFKQPYPKAIRCGACGQDAEIWSDEIKTTCFSCGAVISKNIEQGCFMWCKYAKECIGNDAYGKYVNNKKEREG